MDLRALLATCLVALPAWADLVPFDGSYVLQGIGGLAPIGVGAGVAELNPSSPGAAHLAELGLPGGLATIMSTTTPSTPPSSFPYTKIIATVADGPGAFSETSGGVLRGVMPIAGNVRICLGLGCAIFLDVPLTENGTRGVGLGGAPITATFGGSLVMVSLQGASWSTGSVVASTSSGFTTLMGYAQGAALQTSSTAAGSGVVQMVTPITVTSTASGSPPVVLNLAGVLNVQFAPEPGRAVLLAAGAIALLWLARARRR